MDEHEEKEEDKFQESSEQQQPLKQEAAEEEEVKSKEPMDHQHQEGYKEGRTAEEEATVQLKEVETTGSEEASSPFHGIFAYPCSLLQYLLRAFFGWFWAPLHGDFDGDGKKPQQATAAVAPEAAAPTNSTEQGDGDGEKDENCFYMEEEVVTRVWAVRRGRPPPGAPGRPREGRGGNGGIHH